MTQYSTLTHDDISSISHVAHLFNAITRHDQVVHLNPFNVFEYSLAAISNAASVTLYCETLSVAQFSAFSQILNSVELQSVQIIDALDNAGDHALSWHYAGELSDETWLQVKQWALDNKADVWALKQRPTLSAPGLLLMDMDSTTIKIECIDEIAKLAGVGEQVSEVTELAMQGKLDFAESLRARVATLADADESIIAKVKDNLPLMHGLKRLIAVLKQHEWRVAIASGGFTYFADKLKDDLELDAAIANTLEIKDGELTGQVIGKIVDAQVKAETLNELAERFSIPAEQTVAMGDGANDLVMMAAANLGVAFEAKPLVQEKADVAINFYGLDALLFILAR
ncbi:phosphoserine phosphatase SerB [Algibacillus agarilyticus]|uniref:phosphoserine phosphatase SerB n=1 Tax=Algibacillus agarilyticus TaxID=2234133 RepID=UPI000DD04F72|nr:phosphoserine phosphatase SerB [Algibacillus agarilyticus]